MTISATVFASVRSAAWTRSEKLGLQRDLQELHVEAEPLLELAHLLDAGVEGRGGARVLPLARLERVEQPAASRS